VTGAKLLTNIALLSMHAYPSELPLLDVMKPKTVSNSLLWCRVQDEVVWTIYRALLIAKRDRMT
jgi:hypothetical protein